MHTTQPQHVITSPQTWSLPHAMNACGPTLRITTQRKHLDGGSVCSSRARVHAPAFPPASVATTEGVRDKAAGADGAAPLAGKKLKPPAAGAAAPAAGVANENLKPPPSAIFVAAHDDRAPTGFVRVTPVSGSVPDQLLIFRYIANSPFSIRNDKSSFDWPASISPNTMNITMNIYI
jgi:hypothetical protein